MIKMTGFVLDTSGAVLMPSEHYVDAGPCAIIWPDLDPFTQGYVEAALTDADLELRSTIAVGDLEGSTQDNQLRTIGFRHLSPETLAAILKDCEAFVSNPKSSMRNFKASGRGFWSSRQVGWRDAFPPLTLTLSPDGKVVFA